jgi:hypothetical protein
MNGAGCGVATMPKKSAKKSGRTIAVRGSDTWIEWVEALAEFDRRDVAKLIDAALVEYAKGVNFPKKPPAR